MFEGEKENESKPQEKKPSNPQESAVYNDNSHNNALVHAQPSHNNTAIHAQSAPVGHQNNTGIQTPPSGYSQPDVTQSGYNSESLRGPGVESPRGLGVEPPPGFGNTGAAVAGGARKYQKNLPPRFAAQMEKRALAHESLGADGAR